LAVEADTNEIDDEGICEEVDTFTFEGHDTTSTALIFTALLLGHNQDVQDRVLQEILEILGDRQFSELKVPDFNSMKYLDCVIKESLRLYPPVAYIGRKLTEDIQTG
jgi:cytochrome P450 family 4